MNTAYIYKQNDESDGKHEREREKNDLLYREAIFIEKTQYKYAYNIQYVKYELQHLQINKIAKLFVTITSTIFNQSSDDVSMPSVTSSSSSVSHDESSSPSFARSMTSLDSA